MSTDRAISNWLDQLATSTSPNAVRRVSTKAGMAGKKAGLNQVTRDLGADRAMSNFRRRSGRTVPVGVGFDVNRADGVDMNIRPKGVAVLASSGRKNAGFIGSLTGEPMPISPGQFRAYSAYYPSRGTGVIGHVRTEWEKAIPKAAFKAFQSEIGKALR